MRSDNTCTKCGGTNTYEIEDPRKVADCCGDTWECRDCEESYRPESKWPCQICGVIHGPGNTNRLCPAASNYRPDVSDWVQNIVDFMTAGEQDTPPKPVTPDADTVTLRRRLIYEESQEALEALHSAYEGEADYAEIAKELADVIVVTIGTAVAFGIDLRPIWDAVHASNMAKFPGGKPIKDAHGKILKPKGWKKPDIQALIKVQRS